MTMRETVGWAGAEEAAPPGDPVAAGGAIGLGAASRSISSGAALDLPGSRAAAAVADEVGAGGAEPRLGGADGSGVAGAGVLSSPRGKITRSSSRAGRGTCRFPAAGSEVRGWTIPDPGGGGGKADGPVGSGVLTGHSSAGKDVPDEASAEGGGVTGAVGGAAGNAEGFAGAMGEAGGEAEGPAGAIGEAGGEAEGPAAAVGGAEGKAQDSAGTVGAGAAREPEGPGSRDKTPRGASSATGSESDGAGKALPRPVDTVGGVVGETGDEAEASAGNGWAESPPNKSLAMSLSAGRFSTLTRPASQAVEGVSSPTRLSSEKSRSLCQVRRWRPESSAPPEAPSTKPSATPRAAPPEIASAPTSSWTSPESQPPVEVSSEAFSVPGDCRPDVQSEVEGSRPSGRVGKMRMSLSIAGSVQRR